MSISKTYFIPYHFRCPAVLPLKSLTRTRCLQMNKCPSSIASCRLEFKENPGGMLKLVWMVMKAKVPFAPAALEIWCMSTSAHGTERFVLNPNEKIKKEMNTVSGLSVAALRHFHTMPSFPLLFLHFATNHYQLHFVFTQFDASVCAASSENSANLYVGPSFIF